MWWSTGRPTGATGSGGGRVRGIAIAIGRGLLIGAILIGVWTALRPKPLTARQVRQQLFAELQPVALKNCTLERVGSKNDGGYLMCGDLLGNVRSAYSYGIAGHDGWGCSISRRFNVPVHQYDCFDNTRPPCPGGRPEFHDECVGGRTETIESRFYDTVANQIAKNGDAGKTLVVKMDVEGAEMDSLLATPDRILDTFDQLVMELHAADRAYLELVRKLKRMFHVVHLHYNNSVCTTQWKPFPSPVYEVTFVNRRIGIPDPSRPAPVLPHPLDAQNDLFRPDCQTPIPIEP
jgi:hypothetical protein